MEPYIEYLDDLGVKCSTKDPNNRRFDISLTVTFEFILKHLGEAEYKEAVRISKGRPGNEDLGIEPVEGAATFVHSSNGTSPNGNGHKEHVATNPKPEEQSDDVRASAPTPPPATASKQWDRETLKPALKALVKKHKLKSKGFTGRAPEDSIGSLVVSVKNLPLAEQVFTEAELHYSHKVSKTNGNITIFRFYAEPVEGVTRAYVGTAAETLATSPEEAPVPTPQSSLLPITDPEVIRSMVKKIAHDNDLTPANCHPGRTSDGVVTVKLVKAERVADAVGLFKGAGLKFSYDRSQRYAHAFLFKFSKPSRAEVQSAKEVAQAAAATPASVPTPVASPSPEELTAPPTPLPTAAEQFRAHAPVEREEVTEMGSVVAMTSMASSLARMAEVLEKGQQRQSAGAIASSMVEELKAKGVRLFSVDAEDGQPMNLQELVPADLLKLFTRLLDKALPR